MTPSKQNVLIKLRHLKPSPTSMVLSATLLSCLVLLTNTAHAGDPLTGKDIYNRCIGCHSFADNRTGPRHCNLFGRKAGTVQGFDYSDAMRNSKIVWNETTLDAFLKAPLQNIPGTIMGYAGVKNDRERADLIAYLKQASGSSECK